MMAKGKGLGNIRYEEPEIYDPLGLLDEDDDNGSERISVYEAAKLWRDSGMDKKERLCNLQGLPVFLTY